MKEVFEFIHNNLFRPMTKPYVGGKFYVTPLKINEIIYILNVQKVEGSMDISHGIWKWFGAKS